jgi:hypothetical protein
MLKLWKNRIMAENRKKWEKSEDVEEKIRLWLWQEGFEVRKIWSDDSSFRYLVSKDKLPKFSVGQLKSKSDSIFVESGISFVGIEKVTLESIFDQNQHLSWELRLHLVSNVFFYKIQHSDPHSNNPGGIILAKLIYYDGLSKDKFLDTVFQVLHTTIFIILTLQHHLTISATNATQSSNSLPYLK